MVGCIKINIQIIVITPTVFRTTTVGGRFVRRTDLGVVVERKITVPNGIRTLAVQPIAGNFIHFDVSAYFL
jgi:hypothetical protein